MNSYPPTVVIRHRLENLKKCSLRGLESRDDFIFVTYPYLALPPLDRYILLSLEAPPLTPEDSDFGLLVIDATWRYAKKMIQPFLGDTRLVMRSLPAHFRTAYPRKQADCVDPERGLASVEAIFLSYHLLKRDTQGLLDNYYWKEAFFQKNGLELPSSFYQCKQSSDLNKNFTSDSFIN